MAAKNLIWNDCFSCSDCENYSVNFAGDWQYSAEFFDGEKTINLGYDSLENCKELCQSHSDSQN